MCAITAGIQKSIIKEKKKKQGKMALLAKSKLIVYESLLH